MTSTPCHAKRIAGLAAPLLAFFCLLAVPSLRAQVSTGSGPVVRGVVQEVTSGLPLVTVSVALYRSDGTELATAITNEEGRYSLRAPSAGEYHLRAERIGYHPLEKGPFTLRAADTLSVDFALSPAPLLLDSILVSVRRQGRLLGAGEQLVYGRLLDDESGEPIPQGLLRLLSEAGGAAATTLSDDDGLFWLVSPSAGAYRLQAERIGYKTATGPELLLMLGDTIGLDFYLSMEAILLNPIVVRATARPLADRYDLTGMSGFLRRYERFSKGHFGEFLIRDSIAKYEKWGVNTGQIMAETLMNVRQVNFMSDRVLLGRGCSPQYFLDGTPLPSEYPVWSITPDMLEAVEVYVRPEIPPEFLRGGWPCGVVAYWYRRAPDPRPPIPTWKKLLMGAGILGLSMVFIL